MTDKFNIKACICIPTFNEEVHLPFLLASLENQRNIENYEIKVFISDSESVDRTKEVAKSFAGKSKFEYQILINKGSNKSGNINKVLDITDSDIFIIIDAHCELDEYYIANGVNTLIHNQDIYCAVGGVCRISPSPLRNNFVSRTIAKAYVSPFGAGYSTFKDSKLIKPKSKKVSHIFLGFFNSQDMKKAGGFNRKYHRKQDIEFLERLKRSTQKELYQDNTLKINYFLKQNSIKEIGNRFFNQGRLVFTDKESFRLKHISPLVAASIGGLILFLLPQLFLVLIAFYIFISIFCMAFEEKKEFLLILFAPFFFGIFHFSYLLGTIYVLIPTFKR